MAEALGTYFRIAPRVAGMTPRQVATLYSFPGKDGTGQNLGIISLGGGYTSADLQAMGVNPAKVHFVSVGGARNQPSGNANSADGENALDLGIQGGVCPNADIWFFEADNTNTGFADAIAAAKAHSPTLTALSISWGAPDDQWDSASKAQMDADIQACPFPVFVASGDGGSNDGENAPDPDYPAESPYSVACGGTTITAQNPLREVAWSESGGGFSKNYPRPSWQPADSQGTGRMTPDVASNADPNSGFTVVVGGRSYVFGGTSASAPMWAALWGRMCEAGLKLTGDVHQALYSASATFNDITSGQNGAYQATAGIDPVTGLGTPNGAKLLAALQGGTQPTPTPTPQPSGTQARIDKGLMDADATLAGYEHQDPANTAVYAWGVELLDWARTVVVDPAFAAGAAERIISMPPPTFRG